MRYISFEIPVLKELTLRLLIITVMSIEIGPLNPTYFLVTTVENNGILDPDAKRSSNKDLANKNKSYADIVKIGTSYKNNVKNKK